MAKKFLLIVEGESEEPAFFEQLFKKCNSGEEFAIFTYKTNIHVLAHILATEYPSFDTDEIDIRQILAFREKDEKGKLILTDTYTDVYLIFDFDPQHNAPYFGMVKRMLNYFDNPTDQGKLYINYPMLQSYKHFANLPDHTFAKRFFDYSDSSVSSYKELVDRVSRYKDVRHYNYNTFYSLAVHHLRKLNYILTGSFSVLTKDEYLNIHFVGVYDYEVDLFKRQRMVSVLNTCIFVLCDFAPTRFFRFIKTRAAELYI